MHGKNVENSTNNSTNYSKNLTQNNKTLEKYIKTDMINNKNKTVTIGRI